MPTGYIEEDRCERCELIMAECICTTEELEEFEQ
jgi:hypothetical protein